MAVEFWLGRLGPGTRYRKRRVLERWLSWMGVHGGRFAGLSPEELVMSQKRAGGDDRFLILDLVQRYVSESRGRLNSKRSTYSVVRSFFMHNRADLPSDRSFRVRGDLPKVQGVLGPEHVRRMVDSSDNCMRAVILCMLCGGLGRDEFLYWNRTGYRTLVEQLRREPQVVRVELPGRKLMKNVRPYYTFIGGDALDALREWLKHRPPEAQAIFTNQRGRALTSQGVYMYWLRHLRRVGLIDGVQVGDKGYRSGHHMHELRDVFRTLWAKSPAKAEVAEFLMGHSVDPLEYDKSFKDEAFYRGEYLKALPWLNIMSSGRPYHMVDEESVEDLRLEVERLRKYEDVVGNLRELVFKLQGRIEQMEKGPKLSV